MIISVNGNRDILRKEPNESMAEFSKEVKCYQRGSDFSAKDFCKYVMVEGLSIDETVTLYANLQKAEGSNVVLFQNKVGRAGEASRIPLWKEGVAS